MQDEDCPSPNVIRGVTENIKHPWKLCTSCHVRPILQIIRLLGEAENDSLEGPLGLVDVVDLDRVDAGGLLDGRIVASRVERVAEEEHVGLGDAGELGKAFHAVGLVDARAGDVDGGSTTNANGNVREDGLEVLLDQATLLLLGIPCLFGNKGGLLAVTNST